MLPEKFVSGHPRNLNGVAASRRTVTSSPVILPQTTQPAHNVRRSHSQGRHAATSQITGECLHPPEQARASPQAATAATSPAYPRDEDISRFTGAVGIREPSRRLREASVEVASS